MIKYFREKLPPREWSKLPTLRDIAASAIAASTWRLGRLVVISTLVDAEMPDGNGTGPQWHISVSRNGARVKPHELRRALRAFGMVGAEEDNHHPGGARHFWMPIDPKRRVVCACKTTETVVTEPDGYQWSNEKDGPCRGCELEQTMLRLGLPPKPCPVHPIDSFARVALEAL